MIWSQDDFLREVRRQLVEMETLRRRLLLKGDVEDTIERIEASQRHLIRKLEEYFAARSAEAHLGDSAGRREESAPLLSTLEALFAEAAAASLDLPSSTEESRLLEGELELVEPADEAYGDFDGFEDADDDEECFLFDDEDGDDDEDLDAPIVDVPDELLLNEDSLPLEQLVEILPEAFHPDGFEELEGPLESSHPRTDADEGSWHGSRSADLEARLREVARGPASEDAVASSAAAPADLAADSLEGASGVEDRKADAPSPCLSHDEPALGGASSGSAGPGGTSCEADRPDEVYQARCRICCRLVVSSVVAGSRVLHDDGDWFHAECIGAPPTKSAEALGGHEIWQRQAMN